MQKKIAIYLAGSIQKGHEIHGTFWTQEHMDFLQKQLPNYQISFLNPAFRSDDLSDQFSVFGRDMTQVFCSDLVFVDARDRRGLGVGAEMMWAKMNQIPVLTWAPKDTHYHKSQTTILGVSVDNFIHPFVESLSDHIVENLTDAAQWIEKHIKNPSFSIKGLGHIHLAMRHYQKNQLPKDAPMQALLSLHEELSNRLQPKV